MKVLMVEPGRVPYETEIGESIKTIQAAAGGKIEVVYPYEDPVALVCNREGKLLGLPLNRALYDEAGEMYDIIAGTFFVAGLGEEGLADLPADLIKKYAEHLKYPETFALIDGKYRAVKGQQETGGKIISSKDEERLILEEATNLAMELDCFFRENHYPYAAAFSDAHIQKERLADELIYGSTANIRMQLDALRCQKHLEKEVGRLGKDISAYENFFGIRGYSVYQLAHSVDTDKLRFMPYDWLESKGFTAEYSNYQMVYSAECGPEYTLDDIYAELNQTRPEGYRGYSLSVSDVVILHEKGNDAAYYVDRIGFRELPDFLGGLARPEAKRETSIKEQLDAAKKQAAQAEPKAAEKKPRTPERS